MALLEQAQISRLLDIAYVGAHAGRIIEANNIFDAILAENPTHSAALIGQGLTKIMIDQFSEGEEILLNVLEKNPNDQDALGILALGYFLAEDKFKTKETLDKMDLSDSDSSTTTLAKELSALL